MIPLDLSVDPRQTPFALIECPPCEEPIEITHKMLRLRMWKQDQVRSKYPDLPPMHELTQLIEVTCTPTQQNFVLAYDFEEFAMSAFAFRLKALYPTD